MYAKFRELLFVRAWDIGHETLAGVVQQASQDNAIGQAPGLGFFGAANAVLAYGPEGFYMSVGPADQGQGVGYVFYTDHVRIGVGWFEVFSCVCGYMITHRVLLGGKCSFDIRVNSRGPDIFFILVLNNSGEIQNMCWDMVHFSG